ncbi:FecR family protein [Chitinophaga ginsengisoli]|uniref:FecR family protein n=1 Tax=Chitinophaga ginsengisoli TaxID=363837 RepID=A0A2P8GPK6_9BACT|nr:FecR family protein [Chitinophaga ginsengisoli]PSL35884.1 FecR family protein [Chitinophaga ginsengisoli]
MDYKDYTVKDFLHDELFRKWVEHPDHDTKLFWETWMCENPDQCNTLEEARDVLLMIGTEEYTPTTEDQAEVWSRIAYTIRETPQKKTAFTVWRYAAVFLGVIAVAGWLFLHRGKAVVLNYATTYGETKKIVLPDSSVVRLNANSTLRCSINRNGTREIWLNGEGFFSVVHDRNNGPFLVHTSDVDVQVIGTEFNVNTRRVMTRVILNNGAIKLKLNGEDQQDIKIKPGEMVSYSTATHQLSRRNVNPADYNAWLDNMFVFNETPIAEVAIVLQENLGINLNIEGQDLQKELFTGSIPMSDVAIFFRTLSRSLHVVIEKKDNNSYSIRRKNNQ